MQCYTTNAWDEISHVRCALHMMLYGDNQVGLESSQWNNLRLAQNTLSLPLLGDSMRWQLCGMKPPVPSARRTHTSEQQGQSLIMLGWNEKRTQCDGLQLHMQSCWYVYRQSVTV